MTEVEFRPFEKEDVRSLGRVDDPSAIVEDWMSAETCLIDGEPIFVLGAVPRRFGKVEGYELWTIVRKELPFRHLRGMLVFMREFARSYAEGGPVWAHTRPGNDRQAKFVEALGFRYDLPVSGARLHHERWRFDG